MLTDINSDIRELQTLRCEFQAAVMSSCDPEEQWRLRQTLRELDNCIRNLQSRRMANRQETRQVRGNQEIGDLVTD